MIVEDVGVDKGVGAVWPLRRHIRHEGDEDDAAAEAHPVHMYVERASRRPTRLPEALRQL